MRQLIPIIFSTAMTPESSAIIAATLANSGKCPFSEKMLIPSEVVKSALSQILHACSADKGVHAECEKYGIWLANRSGAGLLIIPGVLGLSFSLEGRRFELVIKLSFLPI